MDLECSTNQLALRNRFRTFAEDEVAPGAAQRDIEANFDHQSWKRLAEEGFWRLRIPEQYGGTGGDLWDFVAASEGLAAGAHDFGFVLSAVAHAGLVQVVLDSGTEEQKRHVLPRLISGQVGATAATESGGGSHVAAIKTWAKAVAGDEYSLTGEKTHITNAPIADLALIVGRIPALGKHDITLFLVERGASGVTFGEPEDLMGQRSSPTGNVVLQDARVTGADIVGERGDGLATLYSFLAFDRLMYGVVVAGYLEPLLAQALERTQNRTAFGRPIADHEYIQDKLVDMKLTMEASRWLAYSTVSGLARKNRFFSAQASLAKLTASEGMVRAGLELIQLFGHAGYDRGAGIERVLRDGVAIRIAGGTSEMQKKNVFKCLVEEHSAAKVRANGKAETASLGGMS